jgi:hypothetical protein
MPWTCPACSSLRNNTSSPSICEVCDTSNPSYGEAWTVEAVAVTGTSASAPASHEVEEELLPPPIGSVHSPLPASSSPSLSVNPSSIASSSGGAAQRPMAGPHVVCIGDLHGCLAETLSLWSNLERELGDDLPKGASCCSICVTTVVSTYYTSNHSAASNSLLLISFIFFPYLLPL